MAKVPLRVYCREIESMIEGGQIDEAIAHCQHILKTFPMHVETYRLLGKAFLEGRRYADAADIFQRALMSVPDDFVSHVGMSIIRDDEGKLDEAIWHMERAYEMQPSNPAIQGELRRLYGRRDGVEPPKIRLTRDALANMYAQGELFGQAIAEIRSILAEDPNRPDLKVMLARAYFHADQKVEAAEMAAELLKKYPYCLDALRILVEVLPETKVAENTQVYRQRLRMLDPYSGFVAGSVFDSEQVADAAVNIERLEYNPAAPPASQPGWASSLGIKLESEKREEEPPAWLKSAQEPEVEPPPAAEAPASVKTPPEAVPAAEEEIPEWMRSMGWQPATGAAEEGQAMPEEEAGAEPLAQAEIPDWLKSMAPPEALQEGGAEAEEAPLPDSGGRIPDWLSPAGQVEETPAEEPQPPSFFEPAGAVEEESVPDWLKDLGAGTTPAAAEEAPQAEEPVIAESPMGGLQEQLEQEQPQPEEPVIAEPPPVFLEEAPAPVEAAVPPSAMEEPLAPSLAEAAVAPGEEAPSPLEAAAPSGAKPLEISDDALAWLEGLAAKQGAKADELLTKPEERTETPPAWLQQAAPAAAGEVPVQELTGVEERAVGEQPAAEAPVAPEMKTPIETKPLEGVTILPPVEEESVLPAEEAAIGQEIPQETLAPEETAPPAAQAEAVEDVTITDWLKRLDETEKQATEESPSATPQEELPDWLRDLEKPSAPAAPVEELPEWLREPAQPPSEQPVELPEEQPVAETVLPGVPAQEPEIPAWLAESAEAGTLDDSNVVATPQPPTTPEEWIPEISLEEGVPPPVAESVEPAAPPPPAVTEAAETVSPPAAPPPVAPPLKATGMLSRIPAQDKDAASLSAAQSALEQNHLTESMQEYAKLIKKGRLLDEVIHDLREATYRHPVDVIVWQTLGDAYMRANRLQDALDAYTKAEELIR